jgi:predicted DNA-binding protein
MALSKAEIQKRSDKKRGVKSKGYKLPIETIEMIAELSEITSKPQGAIISDAIKLYKDSL